MTDGQLTSAEVQSALSQSIGRIPVTMRYRLQLFAVVAGLITLQLLYLLLVAAVLLGAGIYLWAVRKFDWPLNALTLFLYIGPPFAGVTAAVFLLKPLFIRPPRKQEAVRIAPADEPVLFEFVGRLCRVLGSPSPSRIFADLQVNASAAVPGVRGLLLGRLDLTIGLPLVTGMTLPQFTGVLAHEFGHFSQRAGLRSYFLIRTIQGWFQRVVYQRDSWDAWLARRLEGRNGWVKAGAALATIVVTFSRSYLTVLMKPAHWLASSFSRHMEFDADRYEAALIGSDAFEETSKRLPVLTFGAALAGADASRNWSMGRLPDDLPALVAGRASLLPAESSARLVKGALEQKSAPGDTHPSMAERVAAVRRRECAGVFHLSGPAARLFHDLPALCGRATEHHYKTDLHIDLSSARVASSKDVLAGSLVSELCGAAVRQLFGVPAEVCARWFRLPEADPRFEPFDSARKPSPPKLDAGAYQTAEKTRLLRFVGLMLRRSGVKINLSTFQLSSGDPESIRAEEEQAANIIEKLNGEYRLASAPIARWIETIAANLMHGKLGVLVPQGGVLPIPNLHAAWRTYGAWSQIQENVALIRRLQAATEIVRINGRAIHAATCSNLLDDMEQAALSAMARVSEGTNIVPACVVFDPDVPPTVGAQLTIVGGERSVRIGRFVARAETMAARALGQLCWIAVNACPIPERPAEQTPPAVTQQG